MKFDKIQTPVTDPIYGAAPVDLGKIDLSPTEMMCWLYCPVSLAGQSDITLPPNLETFRPIVDAVCANIGKDDTKRRYIYITAKTLWVTPGNPGNRPGWHADGFLTKDLNFVWSDRNPTLFWVSGQPRAFRKDHAASMVEMTHAAETSGAQVAYDNKHLLRLDQSNIHRVGDVDQEGLRTFVKVSVSDHLYAQLGNAINHALDYPHPSIARMAERNCPTAAA